MRRMRVRSVPALERPDIIVGTKHGRVSSMKSDTELRAIVRVAKPLRRAREWRQ
jgi:hypothetical protein